MQANDIWSYGAIIEDEFYGPLEFLEDDDTLAILGSNGYAIDTREPEQATFVLPDGKTVQIDEFARHVRQLFLEHGIDFDHADNR